MKPGLPKKGLSVSGIENDGGVTIKSASGVVLSVIDKGNGLLTVEAYAYETGRTVEYTEVPPEALRNPRSAVLVLSVA